MPQALTRPEPQPNHGADREATDLTLAPHGPHREEELKEVPEALLAHAREILDVADVDLGDDFMAIGGDSLSAVMLATAVERDCKVELPMHVIFDAGSLKEIADFIIDAKRSSALAE